MWVRADRSLLLSGDPENISAEDQPGLATAKTDQMRRKERGSLSSFSTGDNIDHLRKNSGTKPEERRKTIS